MALSIVNKIKFLVILTFLLLLLILPTNTVHGISLTGAGAAKDTLDDLLGDLLEDGMCIGSH